MSVIATGFERAPARPVSPARAARHVLLWLLATLGGLVLVPRDPRGDGGLPPEWFRYPPV